MCRRNVLGWVGLAALLGTAALPLVLVAAFGDAYLTTPRPVVFAVCAIEAAVSVVIIRGYRRPTAAAVLLSALAVALVGSAALAPEVVFPIDTATAPWLGVAACMVAGALVESAGTPLGYAALAVPSFVAVRPWSSSWSEHAVGVTLFGVPVLLGLYLGARRRLVQQLRARVADGRRQQQLVADRVRADERAKLAEEMHDVVTHRVSLMVLQAGALRLTAADPMTRVAAEELRVAGVQALDELRDLVGVLRDPATESEVGASPPAPDPAALVERAVAAGLTVRLELSGSPAAVSPMVGRTVYRLVQEGLTNVGKHAPEASTAVRVAYTSSGATVSVVSEAPATVPSGAIGPGGAISKDIDLVATGSGRGLAGLARRVELIGGRFGAGHDDAGRFVLEATLPTYVPTER
jgi:signal transduction histidine kinase